MPTKLIPFHQGVVTARDASTLVEGELQTATGCEYRSGSTHIYKQPGRKFAALSVVANKVNAIQLFQYDGATDLLVAYTAAGEVREATAFATAATSTVFSAAKLTGLNTTAVPAFATIRDSWIMVNGVDSNRIREVGTVPGSSPASNWRVLGMARPTTPLTLGSTASGTGYYPSASGWTITTSGTAYTDTTKAVDMAGVAPDEVPNEDTYAYGVGQTPAAGGPTTSTSTWRTTANFATTNRKLRIVHNAYVSYDSGNCQVTMSVSGSTVTTTTQTFTPPFDEMTTLVDIPDSANTSAVTITFTATWSTLTGPGGTISPYNGVQHQISSISYVDTAPTFFDTENVIYYGYTERYTDSSGRNHESELSPLLAVPVQANVYGIKIQGLPATPFNTFTKEYVIYRSLDETGGGYPFMYEIVALAVSGSALTYTDVGERSFTEASLQQGILNGINLLYPDGSTVFVEVNGPPPISRKVVPFQGAMVYISATGTKLFYSLSASISPVAFEQVPHLYYLQFTTPYNDNIVTAVQANSGKSLIVYFERYSMLVNYLPQAADPGIFDQRIIEYISNTRGSSGTHTACEFTTSEGRTLAASVDAVGLWVTDGVSMLARWSDDLDWSTLMSGVTLSAGYLLDNPVMERLEFMYASGTTLYELHFFYGRMKQSEDGTVPLITGPHLRGTTAASGAGYFSKHYGMLNGVWVGWSGHTQVSGEIFVEREQAADDSGADGTTTKVYFSIKSGDIYAAESLGRAGILGFGYPKFGTGTKTLDPTSSSDTQGLYGSFRRDGASAASTKSKPFLVGTQKKVYWNMYADRHTIEIRDISATSLPALVAYEIEVRDGGIGRDK